MIYKSRYARFLEKENRRENWVETVARYINFIDKQVTKLGSKLTENELTEITQAIYNLEVMPSMRLLSTAGEAVDRENISSYNCSYIAINNKRAFSEALYILMCGTGLGFSCEK